MSHLRRNERVRTPRLEPLEDRRLLANVTVSNLTDVVNGTVTSIAALIATPGADGISLREAIQAANATAGADEITFAAALSGATITLGGTELAISQALVIDARPLAANVTINANQLSRIFNITAASGDFTLGGLTLTGGRTTATGSVGRGGAIRSLTTGNLTLDQSIVSGNMTTGNLAYGGGISSGKVTITQSTVSGNSTAGNGARGGGIFASGAVELTQSIVSGNTTATSGAIGGGIFSSGAATLTASTVSGNSTSGTSAYGGGIGAYGAVTLTQSTVSGNSTAQTNARGGGIFSNGAVTLTQSTVSGNSTAGQDARGGGIWAYGAVTLTRSTVTENHAMHATAMGGGVFQFNTGSNHPFSIGGSIVAGNTAGGGGADLVKDPQSTLTVNYSLIGVADGLTFAGNVGNLTGTAASPLNPQLGPLANNIGPTQTHALLAGSPAIDAGDPSIVFNPTEFDQRGAPFVRVFDGDGAGGARIDIGAYERQTVAGLNLVVDTTADEHDGDYSSGDLSLREAIDLAHGFVDADEITFATALSGATITLSGTELAIGEALVIDARPLAENVTIDANGLSRIFNITATTGDFTLGGLTLRGGRTTASASAGSGGAIRSLTTGSLALDQSTVGGNSTAGSGARGGGVFASGAVELTQSTVSGNSTTGNLAHGGGIYAYSAVVLTQSTVSGNSTAGSSAGGGGIWAYDTVMLTQSTVSGNSTAGSNAVGGGILAGGVVTLTESTVSGNSTAGINADGGGIFVLSTATFTQSTVSGNSITGMFARGGGVFAQASVTFTQSTVTKNRAMHGTAMGGGVFQNDTGSNHPFSINGSIVAGNTVGLGGADLVKDPQSTLTINYSLIGVTPAGGFVGVGNLTGLDPILGLLASHGGPTQTHALLAGSPAIDAGDPNILFNPAEFDQRGAPFVRVFDGDGASGARIDMGAYERQAVAGLNLVVDTAADEDDMNYSAGDLSLREAIGLANANAGTDEITFAAALSGQTITLGGTELAIEEALVIDGRPLAANVTIDANELSRIFNITATTSDFTLRGLTLIGGKTTASFLSGRGGAIRSLTTGSLTLDQSTVSGNSTAGAFAHGGGIFSYGAVELTQSTVSGNSTLGSNAYGGAIKAGGAVALTDSTLSGNSTAGTSAWGGGIFANATVTLTQTIVSGNSTIGYLAYGGGIWAYGAVTLTQATISGNSTSGDKAFGGGITSFGAVTLTQSTVSGNSTTGSGAGGGGIFSYAAVTLVQSTVSGNSTAQSNARGGGIWVDGAVTLTQSTVTQNHAFGATAMGGGVFQFDRLSNHPVSISGSIVAGNTAGPGDDIVPDPQSTITVTYSLIGNNALTGLAEAQTPDFNGNLIGGGGAGIINPMLDMLADNGGLTKTHALLAGSAAINAGDPNAVAGVSGVPVYDQRGFAFSRVVGGRIDIGAFEAGAASADFDGDLDVDGFDFLAWQRGLGASGAAATRANGNADGDMHVDGDDLAAWKSQFGLASAAAAQSAAIPPAPFEPNAAMRDAFFAVGDFTQLFVEPGSFRRGKRRGVR